MSKLKVFIIIIIIILVSMIAVDTIPQSLMAFSFSTDKLQNYTVEIILSDEISMIIKVDGDNQSVSASLGDLTLLDDEDIAEEELATYYLLGDTAKYKIENNGTEWIKTELNDSDELPEALYKDGLTKLFDPSNYTPSYDKKSFILKDDLDIEIMGLPISSGSYDIRYNRVNFELFSEMMGIMNIAFTVAVYDIYTTEVVIPEVAEA